MYTTSNEYKTKILEPSRKFESEIKIGNRVITNNEVTSLVLQQQIQQDTVFSIGNSISSILNLNFLHGDIDTNDRDNINVKLGLSVNGKYEYIPLGIYNIETLSSNDTVTTIVAYDNMVKFDISYSENSENPTLHSVINRLVQITGVEFGGDLYSYNNYSLSVLSGYSCREVLGFVAGVLGCNAIIDRYGKFKFVSIDNNSKLEITTENYFNYSKQTKLYKISKIVNSTDNSLLELGEITDDTVCLSMSNPFINDEIIADLYNKFNGFSFYPFELSWQGDPSIDLGDSITITDTKGTKKIQPVLFQSFNYSGALNSVLQAQGDSKLANSYTTKTNEESEIDRVKDETANIVENVKGLSSTVKSNTNTIDDLTKEVLTVKNQQSTFEQDLDGFKTTVSKTYTTKAELDNLNIGTRNLLRNTDESKSLTGDYSENQLIDLYDISDPSLLAGKTATLSFKYTLSSDWNGQGGIKVQTGSSTWDSFDQVWFSSAGTFEYTSTITFSSNNADTVLQLRADWLGGTITIHPNSAILVISDKKADWSPAPEDIEDSISEVEQTAKKIELLVKSGDNESNMVLTDKLYQLTTEKALISAKAIEMNGSININNGTFKVDTNGNMTANKGTFKGDIIGSNITGSTMTLTEDNVNVNSSYYTKQLKIGNAKISGTMDLSYSKETMHSYNLDYDGLNFSYYGGMGRSSTASFGRDGIKIYPGDGYAKISLGSDTNFGDDSLSLYNYIRGGLRLGEGDLYVPDGDAKFDGSINVSGESVFTDYVKAKALAINKNGVVYGTKNDGNWTEGLNPCNSNDNCILGWGNYDGCFGSTNIYGNNINITSRNGYKLGKNYFTQGTLTMNQASQGAIKGTQTYLTGTTVSATNIYQNGTSVSGSDIILKDNIEKFSGALDIINKTDVYSFNRILANQDKTEIGFIAQKVPEELLFEKGTITLEEAEGLSADEKRDLLKRKTEEYKLMKEKEKLDEISKNITSFYDLDEDKTKEQIENIINEYKNNIEHEVPISMINQNNVIGVMFQAIKEQQEIIQNLQKRIEMLE